MTKIEAEFKPQVEELYLIAKNILKLSKELEDYQNATKEFKGICVPDEMNKKFNEYDKLTSEYKGKEEILKSLYEKRLVETVGVVKKKIGEAIQQFAKEKGFGLIIDNSKMSSFIIPDPPFDDITKEFIKYYNENFAKTKTQ